MVAQLNVVGRPLGRIEGESKVTGAARYPARHPTQCRASAYVPPGARSEGELTAR